MKVLIVGGVCQGKERYARDRFGEITLNQLHQEVRSRMEWGENARESLLLELDAREDWVVVCDEVGMGVVPVDRFDRLWREEVGRLCCELAQRADVVERVTCGLPLRLKGK